MPSFDRSLFSGVQQGFQQLPVDQRAQAFLDAFSGKIRKQDETGSFSLGPEGVTLSNRDNSLRFNANPIAKSASLDFKIGGPSSIVGRSPEQALDEALGMDSSASPSNSYRPWPLQ